MHRFDAKVTLTTVVAAVALAACERSSEQTSSPVRLESLTVIGREAGEDPDVFGRVGDVEIDDSGNVYVLDRLAGAVQVFDEGGAFVRTIARRGSGPGELDNPTALGWGPEGNLWVVDAGNARYSVFDPLGEIVATHPRAAEGVAGGWPVTFTANRIYDVAAEFGPGGLSLVPFEQEIAGDEVRSVGRVELPPLGRWGAAGIEVEREGQLLLIEVPFSPMLMWQIDAAGSLWYANTAAYEIRRRLLRDTMELVFRGSGEAPAVTDAEIDAALERDPMLERSMMPTAKPPIRGFFPGEGGELWVLLSSRAGEPQRADYFDAVGALVATVDLDVEIEPRPKVRDGVIVGVARDDLGVDRIVRYRTARLP